MKLIFALASLLVSSVAFARPVPVNPAVTPNDPLPVRVLDCGGSIIKLVSDPSVTESVLRVPMARAWDLPTVATA
jgi:hypothetical protein